MGFLEDLKNGDFKSIVLVIFAILLFNLYWCASRNSRSKKEPMTNVSNDIKAAISTIYKADVEAIRNLANVSKKLQEGGLTLPGNLTVQGSFNYLPTGSIIAYNQTTAPTGWAICDGSRGTPDLRGRFIFGNGGSRGMNSTGGAETVALTEGQMPHHNHSGSTSTNGNHNHFTNIYKGFGRDCRNCTHNFQPLQGSDGGLGTNDAGNHSHTFTTDHKGGNQAHENMPPFYVLTYIMKL